VALLATALLLLLAGPGEGGAAKTSPSYATVELQGRVVMDLSSTRAGLPAVTFDHGNHRALYTCRVCHVDLAFAMKIGETQVSATTNEAGTHCGACHDGKRLHEGRPIFRACAGWPKADPARGCTRCHTGPDHAPGAAYEEFKRAMPLDVDGTIDWAAAMRRGLVKPVDAVEGISPMRPPMKVDRDVQIRPLGSWMNGVTFSHRKHVDWISCELCHPEVFPMSHREQVRYSMAAMHRGRHCGACHGSVAFPLGTCQRCHGAENGRAVR
jgi:c(7)-type cytochrome triheme protein